MTCTRLNPKLKLKWTRLITFDGYDTQGTEIALNQNVDNFDMIVFRFGYDTGNTTGAGGAVYRYYFPNDPDNGGAQFNVTYYQDNVLRTGIVGLVNNEKVKIISSPAGNKIALRCVYGINFK